MAYTNMQKKRKAAGIGKANKAGPTKTILTNRAKKKKKEPLKPMKKKRTYAKPAGAVPYKR